MEGSCASFIQFWYYFSFRSIVFFEFVGNPFILSAIYLNKRLLRNEQKHGLEEDEAESYNRYCAEFFELTSRSGHRSFPDSPNY